MDIQYNLRFAAFPWMTEIDWQDHRQPWLFGNDFTAICLMPNYRFVPWQIIRPASNKTVSNIEWNIINIHTGAVIDVYALLSPTQNCLTIRSNGFIDWIVYDASEALLSTMPDGIYYATLYDGNQTWYSEIFKLFCETDPADINDGIGLGLHEGIAIENQIGYDDLVQIGGIGNVIP